MFEVLDHQQGAMPSFTRVERRARALARRRQESERFEEFVDDLLESKDAWTDAGVPVSCNLVGPIFVNQAAAFSDFHVSGANPAGNATLCDAAFVANRFRMVHTRVLL